MIILNFVYLINSVLSATSLNFLNNVIAYTPLKYVKFDLIHEIKYIYFILFSLYSLPSHHKLINKINNDSMSLLVIKNQTNI